VMQQKRLPCPADGTLLSTANTAGNELAPDPANGCTTNNEANGVVPWRSLGLSESDATDGWNHRFTYRVQPILGANNALDMSWCDPAGTEPAPGPKACNSACTNATLTSCTPPATFLTTRGLKVHNIAGTPIMDPAAVPNTGAAYVVISAGASGGGAYLSSGQLSATTAVDGAEEQKNYANAAYSAAGYYVDDSISEVSGATHFDDVLSRPTVLTVINKAGLGPRSH